MSFRFFPWKRRRYSPPPLVHVTHAKAGSTWVDQFLRLLYGKQVAPRLYDLPERFDFSRHRIYSSVFISRPKFLEHDELRGVHRFVVIRDLRDTLVSNYFSVRDTHELDRAGIIEGKRKRLRELSVEDGMAYLIEEGLDQHAEIQRTWAEGEAPLIRYEDLCRDDLAIFRRLFLEQFGHDVPEADLRRAVEGSRFETVFQRKLGEPDPTSHGRQGAPGDWKKHFTPRLRRLFQEKLGQVLIMTGYEPDGSWVEG